MVGLSAIIIVKNGEDVIEDCLDSIKFCDEIVVVDGESEDNTIPIAKKTEATIFVHPSLDFSNMRNFGLSKARGEWILYIDADERVSPELRADILKVIRANNSKIVAYLVKRKNFYLGNHEWPYIEKLERVFKKNALRGWYGKLHESPKVEGKIGELDGFLLHYTHRDLSSMLAKTIEWSKTEAGLRLKDNHPKMTWWRFPRVMLSAFFDSYIRQGGYKTGTIGLIESIYQSFSMFITYARLWEMQKGASDNNR